MIRIMHQRTARDHFPTLTTRLDQIRRFLAERYRASVQLSHKPRTQVLEGRPSRCLGQGRPWASIPLWVSRAPSAGTSTVHIP